MDYRIKYFNKNGFSPTSFNKKGVSLQSKWGFSLIELLIVIGIFAVLFTVSTSVYNNFKKHTNLEVATNSLVEGVRYAQGNAQTGKGDSKWGVEVLSDKIIIFKGDTYLTRDTSLDEVFSFPGGITASGLGEIVFEKLIGNTTTIGIVTLTNGDESKNININAKGTVTY